MKASAREILQRYKAGTRDFRHFNLRGQSFKGAHLEGADFRECDIRSADFTGANLTGANFICVKAGLQKRWATFWLLYSLALSVLLGLCFAFVVYLITLIFDSSSLENQVVGWVSLIILAILCFVSVTRGTDEALKVGALPVGVGALSLVLGVAGATNGFLVLVIVGALTLVEVQVLAQALALAKAGFQLIVGAGFLTKVTVILVVVILTKTHVVILTEIKTFVVLSVIVALVLTLTIAYSAWRAMKGYSQYGSIRNNAVVFAANGGTSFRKANLTDAKFNQATLKGTDFREANLTRTSFHNVNKKYNLERVKVTKTILANPAVRALLVTGDGSYKSYAGANLKGANLMGANLMGANLKEADISDATLENASLEYANLTLTNAVATNFTNAQMTGATIEAWNIESSTKLDNVDCGFVYLLEKPIHETTDNRERRPSSGEFAPGDFTKLFTEVLDTVDLIFREGVDWKAFFTAFKEVQVENEDTKLAVQSIENKGDGCFVVKVTVPPDTDKEKIHRDFTEQYEIQLKLIEEKYRAQLQGKEELIANYREQIQYERQRNTKPEEMINTLASQPRNPIIINNNNNNNNIQGNQDMSNNNRVKVEVENKSKVTEVTGGNSSGNVNVVINELPSSPNPNESGIKELLIELQKAIASSSLSEVDKSYAQDEVENLEKAVQNGDENEKKKQAGKAMRILGLLLPPIAAFVTILDKLGQLFGLG